MVIAALVVFGALLAAWVLAPSERRTAARAARQELSDVATAPVDGLAEAA